MSSVNHAQHERAELCDLFAEVGPDADTLCEGWTTRDLAAHLVVREHRPDAALGIVAAPFERHGERVRAEFARRPFDDLVRTVRDGPPRWSPTSIGPLDRAANTMEFFIHHEDVRRAIGRAPRQLDSDLANELWTTLRRMSKLFVRRSPVGLAMIEPSLGSASAGPSAPVVEVVGDVSELALFVYGRQAHAQVELIGADDDVAALRAADFGI